MLPLKKLNCSCSGLLSGFIKAKAQIFLEGFLPVDSYTKEHNTKQTICSLASNLCAMVY